MTIAFVHRIAALLLLIAIAVLVICNYRLNLGNRELQGLGIVAVTLCLMQVFSGAAIVSMLNTSFPRCCIIF